MSDWTLSKCDSKILHLLSKIHQRLNLKFPFVQDSRQLTSQENQLILRLGQDTVHYKMLVSAMAVDTYTQHIAQIFNQADTLLETLSVCLSNAQKIKNQIANPTTRNQLKIAFQNMYNSVINMTESAILFNPNSPYIQLYRSVISNQYDNLAENIYSSLKQQNQELKQRLRLNEQKITDLQIKLTRILQQHEGCDLGGVNDTMKSYDLKQELERKDQEIENMNEEFCFQIQKYNVVYEALKRELEEYKSIEDNVNTVELIQKLQTQIVVLRQQKQREQMINEQLRRRLQIVSQANYNPSVSNLRSSFRKPQRPLTRPYLNLRDDQYQSYIDNYSETEHQHLEAEQNFDDGQMRIPYRLSQNRGYSEFTPNVPAKTGYRY